MANILIVVYLLIVLAMIAVILLQRSEGGALGMGGGNNGGMAPIRKKGDILTRTTGILAALFMATAIGLSIVNDIDRGTNSILENATDGANEGSESVLDALNALSPNSGAAPVESAPVDSDAPNLALPETSTDSAPKAPTNN